jgi:hypothetical protein
MNDRSGHSIKGSYCTVHRTRDPKLEHACAYCGRQMHLHTGHVLLAKRGIAQAIQCGWCKRNNRLLVAYDGKRWELCVVDQGIPAKQISLGLKVR